MQTVLTSCGASADGPVAWVSPITTNVSYPSIQKTFVVKLLAKDVFDAPKATSGNCTLLSVWRKILTHTLGIEAELGGRLEGTDETVDKIHVGGHDKHEDREDEELD